MNGFNLSDILDAKLGGASLSAIYLGSNKLWPTVIDYSQEYLTFTALTDCTFSYRSNSPVSYSLDNGLTWTSLTSQTSTPTVYAGNKILWKGTYVIGTITFSATGQFNAHGNIMSLLYGDSFQGQTSLTGERCLSYVFNNTNLVSAEHLILPVTTLTEECYRNMFHGCTSLTAAPELPATTLATDCYQNMFRDCTSLAVAPELPATTLAEGCYTSMFQGCTSLTTAPILHATTLTDFCYYYMFFGCTSLNYIKCLATDISASYCTGSWVSGVAQTGTFFKEYYTDWSIGISGIPSGWTVQDVIVDYSQVYFTIESLEDNNRILWKSYNANSKILSWSTDKTNWTTVTSSSSGNVVTTLNTGDKVYIRGNNSAYTSQWGTYNYLTSDGQFNVYGNIMSLINGSDFVDKYTLSADYTFYHLFHGSKVVNASNLILPATTLRVSCYDNMFVSCTQLIYSPTILPATTLKNYCYSCMFDGCTSLITTPELPATTATDGCYYCMFRDTPITTAPELPATTLAQYCYNYMFYGCTSLTTAPELPATTLAQYCYNGMFRNCTLLEHGPKILPATKLVNRCYRRMFTGCSSLNYIKCLATDISATECLYEWVNGVAASGTFVKDNNATWPTGINGIPSGWTVQDVIVDYSQVYFTIESLEDNNEIQFIKGSNAPTKTIEWSTDGTTWTSSTSSTTPTVVTTLNTGDRMMIRGNNTQYASSGSSTYENRLISTKTINMYGNIMSLLYGDNFVGQTTLPAKYTFCRLFSAGKMVDTSNLIFPATNTTEACYRSMLDNNTTLVYSPKILPALTLTKECYVNMFNKASNLVSSPILPALTLAQNCYGGLFYECGKLGEITCLATNISASQCTNQWTYNIKATGTFTKNSSMSSWSRGQYGIPNGWAVVNAS